MKKSCDNCREYYWDGESNRICCNANKHCVNQDQWQPDYQTLEDQNRKLREALEHIIEYWNRDRNDSAMFDACWHAIETAEEALKEV